MLWKNKQPSAAERGAVSAYLLSVIDTPEAGLQSIKLQEGARTPDLESTSQQAVALDATRLAALKKAKSGQYLVQSELIAVARTPGDYFYGVVATKAVMQSQGEQSGIVVSQFTEHEDERATVIAEARYANEAVIRIQEATDDQQRYGWELGIGICQEEGVSHIAFMYAGFGAAAIYHADPSARTSFDAAVPLPPEIWCPPSLELIDALYT